MTPHGIVVRVAMIGYAIYRRIQRLEVIGASWFRLAIVYGLVGVGVGSYDVQHGPWEMSILIVGLLLSVGVGPLRGRFTRVWAESGRVHSQGTALTLTLFLLLVLTKCGNGSAAYLTHVSDDGGFGETLLMIATMIAFQPEIIWRRAQPLGARHSEDQNPRPADLGQPQATCH